MEAVGIDVGYGEANFSGGHKYVLVVVYKCTIIYGMHGTSGANVVEALWKCFIDAGGFPCTIQCDFNP